MSGQAMGGSGAMGPGPVGPPTMQGGGMGQAGGAPPFAPPTLPSPGTTLPPITGDPKGPKPPFGMGGSGGTQSNPPMPLPPQQGGGMVDAGYGQGPLNARGMQSPMGASSQPGLKQNVGQASPPIVPQPPVPQPMPATGQPPKMTVHNPTGNGAQAASEKAAVMRPTPSTKPKAGPMGPPTPQTAGTAKK
jgi:hypothetical protein